MATFCVELHEETDSLFFSHGDYGFVVTPHADLTPEQLVFMLKQLRLESVFGLHSSTPIH